MTTEKSKARTRVSPIEQTKSPRGNARKRRKKNNQEREKKSGTAREPPAKWVGDQATLTANKMRGKQN